MPPVAREAPATCRWLTGNPFVSGNHFNSIYKFTFSFSRVPRKQAWKWNLLMLLSVASIAVVSVAAVAAVAAAAAGVAFILALLN